MRDYANKAALYAAEKFPHEEREAFVQGALWAVQEFVLDLESRIRRLTDENHNLQLKVSVGYSAEHSTSVKEGVSTVVIRSCRNAKEVPAAPDFRLVAFARNGSLFWFGNPQDWLEVNCNLYALAGSKPQLSCSNENKEQNVWCRCGPEHKCSACVHQNGL